MRQSKDRHDPAPLVLVVQQVSPVLPAQGHAAQEPLCPVVRVRDAVLVLK